MKTRSFFWILLIVPLIIGCGMLEVGLEAPATSTPSATLPPLEFPPIITLAPTQSASPEPENLNQAVRITSIQMQDALNGWGLGKIQTNPNRLVLITNDGGHTWQDRTPKEALGNPSETGLEATAFFGANGKAWVMYTQPYPQAYVPGNQVVWRTSDYGQTWQASAELALDTLPAEFFMPDQLGFLDDQHGWLMVHMGVGMSHDYIAIYTTADGGQAWQRVADAYQTPELMSCPKSGLSFSSAEVGWLTGNCPGLMDYLFLYATNDGGHTWQLTSLPAPATQPADLFTSQKAGCGISGLPYTGGGALSVVALCDLNNSQNKLAWLYTLKQGATPASFALPLPYGALQFLSPEEIWFIGTQTHEPEAPGEIYHSLDGGKTWKKVIATGWQGDPNFIDSRTGWVAARTGEQYALVHTLDGGVLWEEIRPLMRP